MGNGYSTKGIRLENASWTTFLLAHQVKRREVRGSRTGVHKGVGVVLLEICGGLDLHPTLAVVSAPMQHIDAHGHATVLECALEDGRNLEVCHQLARGSDRRAEASVRSPEL